MLVLLGSVFVRVVWLAMYGAAALIVVVFHLKFLDVVSIPKSKVFTTHKVFAVLLYVTLSSSQST